MEFLLNRYRNITVLVLVILGQFMLLAYQVKNDKDVRFIRIWTVTAVTPFARVVEFLHHGGSGFLQNYITLHDTNAENRQLREENGRLKLDNIFLHNELSQADRARALQLFQAETQSKTLAAHVFVAGAATGSRVVYVDRGSAEGVERGMAVVTPDGIVGKVIAAYPTASEVLLITDPDFAAGVVSQKNFTHGTLKGQGMPCKMDYVTLTDKIETGERLFTSGEDRIFPRGFPVGIVKSVRDAQPFKEIQVEPSGLQHGMQDVLIILATVHQEIPGTPAANQPVYVAPPLPGPGAASTNPEDVAAKPAAPASAPSTEADKLRLRYKAIGDAQHHTFGDPQAVSAPNFNLGLPAAPLKAPAGAPAKPTGPDGVPTDAARRKNQAAGGPGGQQD